jgi:hypothetical protein
MGAPSPATPIPFRRIALLCLILAVALFFYPVLLGEGLFYFRDVSLNHYPTRAYATEQLRSGVFPLWNPYLSGGMPLAADPNNLILHPITLLFLILPLPLAFTASILLQFLLAGWGMFRWGEEEGLGREAALLAALVFTLSGPLASCGSLQNLLSSWAWVPLALFALARYRRTRSRWALAAHAAALAVQLLAGDPVAAGTTIVIGILLAPPASAPALRSMAARILPSLAGALLACGLALVGILPAREMLAVSGRAGGIPLQDALVWSVTPFRLLELVVPSLYGDPTTLQPATYWGGMVFQKGYPFLLSLYLGAVPILLGFAALGGSRTKKAMPLGAFTLFAVLASLGAAGGVYPLMYRFVPLVSSLRYPSRFMLCASLGVALLSGMGMDRLMRGWEKPASPSPQVRLLLAGSLLVCALGAGAAALPGVLPRLIHEGLGMPASLGDNTLKSIGASLQLSLARCALFAGLFAGMLVVVQKGWLRASWAASAILWVVAGDLLLTNHRINPVVPSSFYEAHPPAADLVDRNHLLERVYAEPRPTGFAVKAGSNEAWWGYFWDQVSCRVSTCLPWKIPMAYDRSTDLLSPASVNQLSQVADELEPRRVKRLADLASVSLIQAYRDLEDPDLTLVGRLTLQTNVPLQLYRNRSPLPRAYLVTQALPEQGSTLESLTSEAWNPRDSVILSGISSPQGSGGEPGTVEWVEEKSERLELHTETTGAGWVVVTDNDYPGWTAEVDGQRVAIQRANHLFRAIQVPAGDHRIIFHYAPKSWLLGGAGSCLVLALVLVWLFLGRQGARP